MKMIDEAIRRVLRNDCCVVESVKFMESEEPGKLQDALRRADWRDGFVDIDVCYSPIGTIFAVGELSKVPRFLQARSHQGTIYFNQNEYGRPVASLPLLDPNTSQSARERVETAIDTYNRRVNRKLKDF